jgi:hypothetical protein
MVWRYWLLPLLCFGASLILRADDIRFSLPDLPPLVDASLHGPLVDLLRSMETDDRGDRFVIDGPFPFKRSVNNVISGKFDAHMPLLRNPDIANPPKGFI